MPASSSTSGMVRQLSAAYSLAYSCCELDSGVLTTGPPALPSGSMVPLKPRMRLATVPLIAEVKYWSQTVKLSASA
jgi:hypothetical protein